MLGLQRTLPWTHDQVENSARMCGIMCQCTQNSGLQERVLGIPKMKAGLPLSHRDCAELFLTAVARNFIFRVEGWCERSLNQCTWRERCIHGDPATETHLLVEPAVACGETCENVSQDQPPVRNTHTHTHTQTHRHRRMHRHRHRHRHSHTRASLTSNNGRHPDS